MTYVGSRFARVADSRYVFDEQMAARDETCEGEPDLLLLPQNDVAGLGDDSVQRGARL